MSVLNERLVLKWWKKYAPKRWGVRRARRGKRGDGSRRRSYRPLLLAARWYGQQPQNKLAEVGYQVKGISRYFRRNLNSGNSRGFCCQGVF